MNALTGFGFEFLLMANQKSQTSFFGTQNQTSNMLYGFFFVRLFGFIEHFGFRCCDLSPQGNWKRIEIQPRGHCGQRCKQKFSLYECVRVRECLWKHACMHVCVCVCDCVCVGVSMRGAIKQKLVAIGVCALLLRFGFVAVGLGWPSSCSIQLSPLHLLHNPLLTFAPFPRHSFRFRFSFAKGQTIRNITY